jgi:3-isopropylmalate/(R)-2-methylmalate dehydratase small subunit
MTPRRVRVWLVGDDISTDYLMPGITMFGRMSADEMASHCLRSILPQFARDVRRGDILVAGTNFGCGSSRPAARNLRALGVAAVVAESFAGLFYRNAINTGLPLIEIADVSSLIGPGDEVTLDLAGGTFYDHTRKHRLTFKPYESHIQAILDAGGLIPLLRQRMENAEAASRPGSRSTAPLPRRPP